MYHSKIYQFCVLLFCFALFTNCTKDSNDTNDTGLDAINNVTWTPINGQFYLDNLDTGEGTYFDHFDPTRTASTLDPISGV
jgi:hypothetical protein